MVAGPDNQTDVNAGACNGDAPVSNGNVSKIESWQDERLKLKVNVNLDLQQPW